MRRGKNAWTSAAAGIFLALSAQEAHAFSFPERNDTFQVMDVPEHVTGEVWALARVESWEKTRNTVWSHCEAVLQSYGTSDTAGVISCEADVAEVNGVSNSSLSDLSVGELIALPLTRVQVAALREDQKAATPAVDLTPIRVSLSRLEEQIAAEGKNVGKALERLEAAVIEQARTLGGHTLAVNDLSLRVKTLEEMPVMSVPERARTIEVEPMSGDFLSTLGELGDLLQRAIWIPLVVGGVIVILLILLASSLLHARTEAVRKKKLESRVAELEGRFNTYFNFDRQEYVFDGEKYWIEQMYVEKEGPVYRTPFGERVKEKNLKSHFAHETKKEEPLRNAA